MFGSISQRVKKVKSFSQTHKKVATSSSTEKDKGKCCRRGKAGHHCYIKNATCNYCKLPGHLNSVCRNKKSKAPIKMARIISVYNATNVSDRRCRVCSDNVSDNFCAVLKLQILVYINSQEVRMKLDTAAKGNFFREMSEKVGQTRSSKVLSTISICH